MKKLLLLSSLTFFGVEMANAQKAYTYVQQNDNRIEVLGTAAFEVDDVPSVEFDENGKVVMTINGTKVAELPMANGGQLCVDFEAPNVANTVSASVSSAGLGTIYSPFQLVVPEGAAVEVYAPTYDAGYLRLNNSTYAAPSTIIPVGTGLVLKNEGDIEFGISAEAPTLSETGVLEGSALLLSPVPSEEGKTLFTLGHSIQTGELGFYEFVGNGLVPGKAYFFTSDSEALCSRFIPFSTDESTAIKNAAASKIKDGKYMKDGHIVIVKNGITYSIEGIKTR